MGARPVDAAYPASAGSTNVDVSEWTATARVGVKARSTHELGVARFDALDSVQDHFHVGKADLLVAVEIGHLPVSHLVDEDVGRVAELVAAVTGTAFTANGLIMRGRAEP